MSNPERYTASSIVLRVGGIRVRFASADSDLLLRVTFPRTRFVSDDTDSPDTAVHVAIGDPDPGSSPLRFASGGSWHIHDGHLGGDRIIFYTALGSGGRAPMSRLDLTENLSRGELVVARRYVRENAMELGYPLDEYLIARLLTRRGATILHASCVAENGSAYVFTGHSGAGKSTISSIAEECGWRVLSDDRTVLTFRDGVVTAGGTPWHGSHKSGLAETLPVRAIFLLEQADEDSAYAMDSGRAFAELFVRTISPLVDSGEQTAILDTVERVVRSVPSGVLRFRPTPQALVVARQFVSR